MKFVDSISVLTADQEKVGEIERVVIDPSSRHISHLVIGKGFLCDENKIVPVSLVDEANDYWVLLKQTKAELELEPFVETHYIPLHKLKIKERYHPEFRQPLYAYPDYPAASATVWGTTWFFDPDHATWSAEKHERNVPDSATALNEGAKVFSDDGEHVGNIESVHTTDDSNRVTHFVISFEGYKLIPAFWVSQAKEEKVQLGVHSGTLEDLPDYNFREET